MKVPYLDTAASTLKQWLAKPVDQLGRWQRAARFLVELGRHTYGEMTADHALEMAAALTYRTIFGLIPLTVVGLLVFRAFGGFAALGPELQEHIYSALNLNTISLHQQDQPADADQGETLFHTPHVQEGAPDAGVSEDGRHAERVAEQQNKARGKDLGPTAQDARHEPIADEPAAGDADAASPSPDPRHGPRAASTDVEQILAYLNRRASHVSFTSIGIVGLVLLLWAAISLVVTVEQCFNRVFQSTAGRSWIKRITTYWAVITLGPVLVAASLYFTGAVVGAIQHFAKTGMTTHVDAGTTAKTATTSNTTAAKTTDVTPPDRADAAKPDTPAPDSGNDTATLTPPSPVIAYLLGLLLWALELVTRLAGLVATIVLLLLMYMLLPNTKVRLRPALIGAAVAAVLWEAAKFGFGLYVNKAVGISALYGSLGLIPLFLLWLYLTWVIVILGLELTYTLQAMRRGRFQRLRASRDAASDLDPRWVIALMAAVARAFERGETITDGDLAGELGLPLATVQALAKRLEEANLLHEVEQRRATMEGASWSLARPARQVAIAKLLEVGESLANQRRTRGDLPGAEVLQAIRDAQRGAVGEQTLAAVVDGADIGE